MHSHRRSGLWVLAFAATVATPDVFGLTPPSASDGPVKLLACVVTPTGILEAQVDNQTDEAVECPVQCTYELGERKFSHHFTLSIPARFTGRLGRFDTSNGKAGHYSGSIGTCRKISRT
jgi:hypothetical protein